MHAHTLSIAHEGAKEFEDVVEALDTADEKLKETLEMLRTTIVEAKLRPEGEGKRSLLDFVDEGGVDVLVLGLKESIKGAGKAKTEFEVSNQAFASKIAETRAMLGRRTTTSDDDKESHVGLIPEILGSMEERAQEMASNLESLVTHFDLCVTAVKHTEGGGDAAQKITGDLPQGMGTGPDNIDSPPKPISEEERVEMVRVLGKDAAQVEDVVADINDSITDMEAQFEEITACNDRVRACHDKTIMAFSYLEDVGSELPNFIKQGQLYMLHWDEEKSKFKDGLEELEGLRGFYDGFLGAYENLIIEIGRRKALEMKMEQVAQDATVRIAKLAEDDAAEREAFRQEQGDFLPMDLWPGMTAEPMSYEIVPALGSGSRVPDISRSIIQQAIRKVTRKQRT